MQIHRNKSWTDIQFVSVLQRDLELDILVKSVDLSSVMF